MYYYIFAISTYVLCFNFSFAQSSSTLAGARASGLGYTSSCLDDEWSILNNIAGLARVKEMSASATYDAHSSFKPFNRTAAVFALPLNVGVAGIGISHFGDKLYNEQILAAGYSNTFGLASLGVKLNYVQYNAEGFGRKSVLSISFGGLAKLTEKIFIGAHIININQPYISRSEKEKLPTVLILGIAFKLSAKTFVTTELEKDMEHQVLWKTGFEYALHKKFIARTGFNMNPHVGFLGVGFRPKRLKIDYAYQTGFNLGARHQTTVSYTFNHGSK